MKPMAIDREKILTEIIINLGDLYRVNLSPVKIGFYINGLRDMEIQEIKYAIDRHTRDTKVGRNMPTIADLLSYKDKSEKNSSKIKCDKCSTEACFSAKRNTGGYIRFCADHYYQALGKTEIDEKREKIGKEFIAEAKKLGLTNRELFALKNPKLAEAFSKNENMATNKNNYKPPTINVPNNVKLMKDLIGSG